MVEAERVVSIPYSLAQDLFSYGSVHTVTGVCYGRTHKEAIDALSNAMLAAAPLPPASEEALTLAAKLEAWLRKRGEPDSGIIYHGPWRDEVTGHWPSEVRLHGADADFVAAHFHGKGAVALADAIRSQASTRAAVEAALDAYVTKLVNRHHGDLAAHSFVDAVAAILGRNPTAEMDARARARKMETE